MQKLPVLYVASNYLGRPTSVGKALSFTHELVSFLFLSIRHGLFDCVQIWYRVSSRHRRYAANVQGHRAKGQGHSV